METLDITFIVDREDFFDWLEQEQILYSFAGENLIKVPPIEKIIIQEFWGI